jgi:hypothetical protein
MPLPFPLNGDTIIEDARFVRSELGIANMEFAGTARKVGEESAVG